MKIIEAEDDFFDDDDDFPPQKPNDLKNMSFAGNNVKGMGGVMGFDSFFKK